MALVTSGVITLVSNIVKIEHMYQQAKLRHEGKHARTYTNTQHGDIKKLFFFSLFLRKKNRLETERKNKRK